MKANSYEIPLKPSKFKRPRGRLIIKAIKLETTPEQVAQAIFKAARKPTKPKPFG